MDNDAMIREKLEFLKNYTYEELKRLKLKILEKDTSDESITFSDNGIVSGDSNCHIGKGLSMQRSNLLTHKKAYKKSYRNNVYRKYKGFKIKFLL
ncbi:MAG: hypothetical protein N3I35_06135 [Clostridia bacterium]|nr:hypothetical protein [Clostridia bacterium]